MKRVLVFFLSTTAWALPVGNPLDPALYTAGVCESVHVRFAYYGDFIFQRNVEVWRGGLRLDDALGMGIVSHAGMCVLDLCEWLDLFALVGTSNLSVERESTVLERWHFSPAICWSAGGRATLWECGAFGVGIEGQYFSLSTHPTALLSFGDGSQTYFNAIGGSCWSEWQGGVAVAYSFCGVDALEFVPYLGVKGSAGELTMPHISSADDFKTKKLWGYAVGMSVLSCGKMGVTSEARFGDEKALFINGQISF